MALREPTVVERHIVRYLPAYAAVCGVVGVLTAVSGWRVLGADPLLGVVELALGLWVVAGPWTSRRLVRRWDAHER